MEVLARYTMMYSAWLDMDLSGILCGVTDWYIVDSETIKLRKALNDLLPGCGDYAAFKVHKMVSLGSRVPLR
jgi:hypothetical protein